MAVEHAVGRLERVTELVEHALVEALIEELPHTDNAGVEDNVVDGEREGEGELEGEPDAHGDPDVDALKDGEELSDTVEQLDPLSVALRRTDMLVVAHRVELRQPDGVALALRDNCEEREGVRDALTLPDADAQTLRVPDTVTVSDADALKHAVEHADSVLLTDADAEEHTVLESVGAADAEKSNDAVTLALGEAVLHSDTDEVVEPDALPALVADPLRNAVSDALERVDRDELAVLDGQMDGEVLLVKDVEALNDPVCDTNSDAEGGGDADTLEHPVNEPDGVVDADALPAPPEVVTLKDVVREALATGDRVVLLHAVAHEDSELLVDAELEVLNVPVTVTVTLVHLEAELDCEPDCVVVAETQSDGVALEQREPDLVADTLPDALAHPDGDADEDCAETHRAAVSSTTPRNAASGTRQPTR